MMKMRLGVLGVTVFLFSTITLGADMPLSGERVAKKTLSPAKKAFVGIQSSAGIELGGNGAGLFSDPTVQAFGGGAGYQGSLFFNMWDDKKIGGKFRIESVLMQEEAIQKTNTSYIAPGTSLKSLTQQWTLISAGAEGHFMAQAQTFFWEALAGYALGSSSCSVTLTTGQPDQAPYKGTLSCNSGIALSGGVGIKKSFGEHIIGLMSVRTMFFLGPIYSSAPLSSRTLIPFPVMFNVGLATPFGI